MVEITFVDNNISVPTYVYFASKLIEFKYIYIFLIDDLDQTVEKKQPIGAH